MMGSQWNCHQQVREPERVQIRASQLQISVFPLLSGMIFHQIKRNMVMVALWKLNIAIEKGHV